MVSCILSHSFVHNHILFLFLLLPNIVITLRVGKISNTTYITSSIDQLFSNLTCSQCTCAALISDGVGWNCMTSDKTCQVISNYSTNNGYLERTNNGNFFFRQFPPQLFTLRVGKISNTTYITSSIDQLFSNLTCSQCTCAALISDGVGWNCMTSDKTCQVISNYSTNNGYLERTNNGNFFFRQFPPQLLLAVADTDMTSTSTIPTTSARSTTLTRSTSESFLGKCEFTFFGFDPSKRKMSSYLGH